MFRSKGALFSCVFAMAAAGAVMAGGRVLIIDSYHEGYPWSDGVLDGAKAALKGKGVELKIFRMDTKRNQDPAFARQKALEAKGVVESFKPDVVIACDDNANKFLVVPFLAKGGQKVVFCGVNTECGKYGYPTANITGMVEVEPAAALMERMKPYMKGTRVAYLAPEDSTNRAEGAEWAAKAGAPVVQRYTKSMAGWEAEYVKLQDECDMLIVGNGAAGGYWDRAKAEDVVMARTKVPTASVYDHMAGCAMISVMKSPEEQGRFAAEAALKIMAGARPGDIPVATNQEFTLCVNKRIAKALGIAIAPADLKAAKRVIE